MLLFKVGPTPLEKFSGSAPEEHYNLFAARVLLSAHYATEIGHTFSGT